MIAELHAVPRGARALALRAVDGIVAISDAVRGDLVATSVQPEVPTLVAPIGVPDDVVELPTTREEARRELGLPLDARLAVFTGRLHAEAVQLLMDAADRLRNKVELLLIGDPPDAPAERRRFERFRVEARERSLAHVHFVGGVAPARVPLYQRAADVLVAPYTADYRDARYTSPLKLFEYMAAGRPIVASELPVLREVLVAERNALLVPLGDGAALAGGIRRALDTPGLAERLGHSARADARGLTTLARAKRILAFAARLP